MYGERSNLYGLSPISHEDLPSLMFQSILKDDASALIATLEAAASPGAPYTPCSEEGKEKEAHNSGIPDLIATLVAHPLPSNLPPPPDFEPSGSPLHLCCVLDRPVHLALLLVSGGDIEARHGGFRRGVTHEACCTGDGGCLEVLLEIARSARGEGTEIGNEERR